MTENRIIAKGVVIGVLLIVGGTTAWGAGSFRIEDYIPQRFTDLEWRLDGQIDLTQSDIDEARGEAASPYYQSEEYGRDNRQQRLRFHSYIDYRYETIPRTLRLSADVNTYFISTRNETWYDGIETSGRKLESSGERARHSWVLALDPSLDYKTYVIGDLFAAIGADASARFVVTPKDDYTDFRYEESTEGDYIQYDTRTYRGNQSEDSQDWAISVIAGPGWGRIYEGEFAATAMYMVDELKKVGLLTAPLTDEEMLQLTEIIYQNRLVHAVDNRVRKIDALNAVMEYLSEVGALDGNSRYGYALIQDVWDYFPKYSRQFGTQVVVGIGWEYGYSRDHRSQESNKSRMVYQHHVDNPDVIDTLVVDYDTSHASSTSRTELANAFVTFQLAHYRPLSLKWQWDSFAELYYYLHADGLRSRYSSSPGAGVRPPGVALREQPGIEDYYQFSFGSSGTYIFSSRTNLGISAILTYDRFRIPIGIDSDRTQVTKSWHWLMGSSLKYRLSIPTTLSVSVSYRDQVRENVYQSDYRSDSGHWSVSAGISHYLY